MAAKKKTSKPKARSVPRSTSKGKVKPPAGKKKTAAKKGTAKKTTTAKAKKKSVKKAPAPRTLKKKPTSSARPAAKTKTSSRAPSAPQKKVPTAKRAVPKSSSPRLADKARKAKERAELEAEKKRAQKERERERIAAQKAKEAERRQKEKEKARLAAQKEKERKEAEKEKARIALEKEREKARIAAQKEKERLEKEKEKERERIRKEKEKLEAARKREEERIRKEKEREAYRKAREAERAKVRAEKEAAKRALEGRIARQARQAQKIAGNARGASSRVYRPDAIPSQSGTTREHPGVPRPGIRPPLPHLRVRPSVPPVPIKPPPPAELDARWALIQERLKKTPEAFQREYAESFDMSWIHHDSALEGVVYTFQELKTAIDDNIVVVPDSSLQPVCEEIRRHKAAIDVVRELGNNDVPLSADVLKRLYLILHPEEGDLKSVKYRKEIPQHRLYFHEYAAPDKIAVRIRQALDWFHGPEAEKLRDPIRVAARLHYDLLRTFPFPEDSGKVSRMLMNVVLLRAKYPPAILHSTERQRYYDALRGALPTIVQMVTDSIKNALTNIEKMLDEEDEKLSAESNRVPA